MARAIGLSIPLRVNKGGGAAKETEENQLDKLVVSALQEGGDENPFQDLGMKSRIIFRINDDAAKFDVVDDIKRILKAFEGRLELGPDGIVVTDILNPQTEEAESNVHFEYINLDINEAREFAEILTKLGDI